MRVWLGLVLRPGVRIGVCFPSWLWWCCPCREGVFRRLTSPLCPIVELNVGGIVAAVLVTLILLGALIFGIWFAYSRGYFDSEYLPSKVDPPCFGA